MIDRADIAATEQQWYVARNRMKQLGLQSAVIAIVLITAISIVTSFVVGHVSAGFGRYLLTGSLMLSAAVPLTGMVWWRIDRQQRRSNRLMKSLRSQLKLAIDELETESDHRQAEIRRQEFERRLSSALEMVETEPEVVGVIERALTTVAPDASTELLLADNSYAHLRRVASQSPDGTAPGCSVDSPDRCPAARRSQLLHFADEHALDVCPLLRDRLSGSRSATCVPVSILGRTVGVLHSIEPVAVDHAVSTELDEARHHDLTTLADRFGSRVGVLRMMAESQLQASTDSLTGLLNRRSMENQVRELRRTTPVVSVVLADLDHFKTLNDTFGHDTGDRALRLFATTLGRSLRHEDLVSRHGGEEFVAVLPGCSAARARDALDVVRSKLRSAVAEHGLPEFTCSFGVAEATGTEEFAELVARADVALFEAKRAGRDRVVLHGADGPEPPRVALVAADRTA